ncbi:MAG TPA: PH domain-containing protein [Pseudogracilibacillus sp.]|nr:PH domain-containing protein [Pseudogracilibacillus sp.]
MIFNSKRDTYFKNFMLVVVIITGAGVFWPLFIEDIRSKLAVVLVFLFLIVTGFILWTAFSIKYVFYQDYLFVKGGPFRSRIPYENITTVSPTTAIFTGYKILSSRDAIEIFYKNATLGSVKISPEYKNEFILELKKRNPNLQIKQ